MTRFSKPVSRRNFLQAAGIGILGITLTPLLDGCESNLIEPLSAGTEIPFITPSADMYYQNGAQASIPSWTMPRLDAATWRLAVDGLVSSPGSFSLADLNTLGAASMMTFLKTQQCVLDAPLMSSVTGLTGTAYWSGFPLRTLLDHCGIDTVNTKRVRFHGSDGFTNNLLIARLYGSQDSDLLAPMLVTSMNGAALSAEHGFPVRLMVTELFGFKNVKWLTRIEATADDSIFGTYQDAGFFDDGTLAVNSRMTRPLNNMTVTPGAYQLSGFAVAGSSGVNAVEISADGGAWQPAEIVSLDEVAAQESIPVATLEQIKQSMPYPFRGVWTKWRFAWTATPGSHTLAVRASDRSGNVQPAVDNSVANGANGIVTISVQA